MRNINYRIFAVLFISTSLILTNCVENHLLPDFGTIILDSDPIGAEIYVDDENTGKVTPDSLSELMSGEYNIRLKYDEFIDTSFNVQLSDNQKLSYNIFMKEIDPQGEITLLSNPDGAVIFIDNVNTQRVTPATFSNLERGLYNITLKLDLYDDSQFTIDLEKDESIEKNTRMIIAGTAGGIIVNSTPSGALITLDDFDTGLTTPDTLTPLAPGSYNIKLSLDNYRDTTVTANVTQGELSITNIQLTFYEPRGSIELSSNPSGARIYLDNVDQEIFTPNIINRLEAGNYEIKLELDEYFDTLFTVNVIEDQRTVVPTVNLVKIPYTISVSVNPEGSGTVSGAGSYNEGEEVKLIATPSFGYNFVNWKENDNIVSSDSEYRFKADSDRNLTANFELKTYVITATTSPENAGIISGTGEYTHGDLVELSVSTQSGFQFINWTEDGSEVSFNSSFSFTATSDREFVANFNPIGTLTINSDPVGASIYLNNAFTGQLTPHTFENIIAGEYTIRLELEDFADTTIVTDVFSGQTTNIGSVFMRDITPEVDVTISYDVSQDGRIIFTFVFNQDIRFDRVDILTPTNLVFPQSYGGVLLPEGVGITWTYAEVISGEWTFSFEGRKVDGRQFEFNLVKSHQVD